MSHILSTRISTRASTSSSKFHFLFFVALCQGKDRHVAELWSPQTRQRLRQRRDFHHFSLGSSFHNLYSASKHEACFHPSQEQIAPDGCDRSQPARITRARLLIQNGVRTRHATLVCKGTTGGWSHPSFSSSVRLLCPFSSFNRPCARIPG